MSRDSYFHYLDETAAIVGPYIAQLYTQYGIISDTLNATMMLIPGTRASRPLQKPGLFRLVFELCGGENWQNYVPVAAAFEVLNISSYQANVSFDEKRGTLTREQKDAQYICAMLSRELACEIIGGCQHLSPEQKARIRNAISKINRHIYLAQYMDLFVLRLSDFDRYKGNEKLFLEEYFLRCQHGSGVFNSEVMACAAELAGNSEARDNLAAFGEVFGTALHLINDLGDYAPSLQDQPSPRDYQDRYSDFKNGRLTLVLYHLLAMSTPDIADTVRQLHAQKMSPDCNFYSLSNLVYTAGSFQYAKGHARQMYRHARSLIDHHASHERYPLLMQALSVLRNNKYTVAFNAAFGGQCRES